MSLALVLFAGLFCCGVARAEHAVAKRADIISLQPPGAKQERAVPFLHDQHAKLFAAKATGCVACHPEQGKKNWLSLEYMRRMPLSGSPDKKELKKLYHTNCIGCHQREHASGRRSGPTDVFCGKCHGAGEDYASALEPVEMGQSLHMRHIFGIDKNRPIFSCENCHHVYDPQAGHVVYRSGTEGSCRYCHKQTQTIRHGEAVLSLADASHLTCITCHRLRIEQNKTHGPISCSGCHGLKEQKAIQARDDQYRATETFPQLDRGQADYCTVSVADGVPSPQWDHKVDFMPLVSFPHRTHEDRNRTCRICHHAAMEPCAKRCHTLDGSAEGDFLTLRAVMHDKNAVRGCVGCHAQTQGERQCAGCHPPERRGVLRQSQCVACHNITLNDPRTDDFSKLFMVRDFGKQAQAALSKRPRITKTFPDTEIPAQVRIGKLAREWAPAEMPHRRIVKNLVAKAGANGLAAYFHASPGTFCQGCHHHAPAEKIPSACSHCHGNFQSRGLENLPELREAYHTACIGCHERMGLVSGGASGGQKQRAPGPDDCQECHKAKQ